MKKYGLISSLMLCVIVACICFNIDTYTVSQNTSHQNVNIVHDPYIRDFFDDLVPTANAPETAAIISSEKNAYAWKEIYMDFLTKNYDKLNEACIGGIAGIGFLDLDLDGSGEMLIFDYGASAAMGVQIFDIFNGEVECISSNMPLVREYFAGKNFTNAYINTGLFENFRLMENTQNGERYFMIESGNGSADFMYQEWIKFSKEEDSIALSSLLYKYQEFDENGNTVTTILNKGEVSVSLDDFNQQLTNLAVSTFDTNYEAKGTFVWEDPLYIQGFQGFMKMTQNSLNLYKPI